MSLLKRNLIIENKKIELLGKVVQIMMAALDTKNYEGLDEALAAFKEIEPDQGKQLC